jgi:hypothetical protein
MEDLVLFGSRDYFLYLALLIFGRGMDFLSTWIATPNLALEANPLAKKLGWKWGLLLNAIIVSLFALWPLPAVVIITTSILVAARNFQSAWLMRSLGEYEYRSWMAGQLEQTPVTLYVFCLLAQTALIAIVGAALMYSSYPLIMQSFVPFGIGMGVLTYAVAVTFYTLLAVWRLRRSLG